MAKVPKYHANIFLDKEGNWYHEGVRITHARTLALFSRSIERDPKSGRYFLEVGNTAGWIDVEDTPYFVHEVTAAGEPPERYVIRLSDMSEEALDPASLRVGVNNVLYCTVKDGAMPARFLRKAYYQLAAFVEQKGERFVLPAEGRDYEIRLPETHEGCADV
ncbi:MAG: DUF1285 domain-containing protein [Myxococcales bacterium]|nr:DUF1285 domain-containing protein [Myxococcales bacterium]